ILGLAEIVQVRPLDLDARFLLPHRAFIGGRVRLEQQDVAAAVAVSAIVNRHRHEPPLGEAGGVFLDADRLGVDAVSDHDRRPLATRVEPFREEDSAVAGRSVAVERDLPRPDAFGQREDPILRLRATLALHFGIGGLLLQLRSILLDDLGIDLRLRRGAGQTQNERYCDVYADATYTRIP